LRVLTWNLFHGRALSRAGRDLEAQFTALIAGWPWDVALLQEVPPWWPPGMAAACGGEQRTALTSRNALLPIRRWVARRDPDLAKSNGGGSNAVLSRLPIARSETLRLARRPERRVAQLLRLQDGTVIANHHGSTRVPLAERELAELCAAALERSDGGAVIVGGDMNLRAPRPPTPLAPVAARDVDHIFAARAAPTGEPTLHGRTIALAGSRLTLSDHPPLEAQLA